MITPVIKGMNNRIRRSRVYSAPDFEDNAYREPIPDTTKRMGSLHTRIKSMGHDNQPACTLFFMGRSHGTGNSQETKNKPTCHNIRMSNTMTLIQSISYLLSLIFDIPDMTFRTWFSKPVTMIENVVKNPFNM